jgi:hypothetical protein
MLSNLISGWLLRYLFKVSKSLSAFAFPVLRAKIYKKIHLLVLKLDRSIPLANKQTL